MSGTALISTLASLIQSARRPWVAFAALFTIGLTLSLLVWHSDGLDKGAFQFSMAVGSYFIGIAPVAYGSKARISAMIFFCGGLVILLGGWNMTSSSTFTDSVVEGSMINAGGLIGAFFTKVLQEIGVDEPLQGPPGPAGMAGRDGLAGQDGRDGRDANDPLA